MAISTDTSTNFSSSTGYTLFNSSNISFSSGVATLTSTDVKEAAIRTPQIDSSAWGAVLKCVPTLTESKGFAIRFLFSFDDWTASGRKYYQRFVGGAWQKVASDLTASAALINAVNDSGMQAVDVANIRDWPADALQRVSVLVGLERTAVSATGSIDLLTWSYGTESVAVAGEGTSSQTLAFTPERGFTITYSQPHEVVEMHEAYSQVIGFGGLRKSTSLTWFVNTSDKTTLQDFLNSSYETPFAWQPHGWPSSYDWKVSPGSLGVREISTGIWEVSAGLEEVL